MPRTGERENHKYIYIYKSNVFYVCLLLNSRCFVDIWLVLVEFPKVHRRSIVQHVQPSILGDLSIEHLGLLRPTCTPKV